MDAIQVDPGATPRKDHVSERIIKIPRSPTKYVFRPEVVKSAPNPNRGGFSQNKKESKDRRSSSTTNSNENANAKNILFRQDAAVGFKGFFSTKRSKKDKTVTPYSPSRENNKAVEGEEIVEDNPESPIKKKRSSSASLSRTTFRCDSCGEIHDLRQHHIHRREGFVEGQTDPAPIARGNFFEGESPFEEISHEQGLNPQEAGSRRFLIERRHETPVASLLYRSRSLPQLSVHDSGVGSNEQGPSGRPASRLVADLRQLLTLKQHYYPEGGWGWVILVVGVMVQILAHGIHGASGVILPQVTARFGTRIEIQSGKSFSIPLDYFISGQTFPVLNYLN